MGGLVVMKASYGQRGCRASAEKVFQGELNSLLSVGVYTTKWILGAFMDLDTSNWQCRRALVNHPNKSLAGGCSSWCNSGFVLQKASVMSDVSYKLQLKSFLGHFPHSSGSSPHSASPCSTPMARGRDVILWQLSIFLSRVPETPLLTDDSSSSSKVSGVTHAGSEAEYLLTWHDHSSPFSLGLLKRHNVGLHQTLIVHRFPS